MRSALCSLNEVGEKMMNLEAANSNFRLVGRKQNSSDTIIRVGDVVIGNDHMTIIAGPCSIESTEQIETIAHLVKANGGHILRGGAFKPRTSPYAFQGLGLEGLKMLRKAGDKFNMPVITEVMDVESFPYVEAYADIIQIGARNMSNFSLLKRAGKSNKPILLKRGMAATIEEFLLSAEYILHEGNRNVILCERGIRTFETYTRNTLDLSSVPILKQISHLPVIIDPSHGTGQRTLVKPMSRAAIAVGADGLMIEVHHNPSEALCDGPQSLLPDEFGDMVKAVNKVRLALD